jgi:3',5'-cyclic-AMP phosphodiesterase
MSCSAVAALRISAIAEGLVTEVRYLNASSRGGTVTERLPVLRGTLTGDGFADELDAIIACSDLQGIVRGRDNAATLLGVAVAETLEQLAFDRVLPPAARTGVILAGDLYSVPTADKRGGLGDVADVWAAFAESYAWVAGVAGNHDDAAKVPELATNVHLLDGDVVSLDGIRIGGVGGIIGNPEKPMRRSERDFLARIDRGIDAGLDLLVLHQGPSGGEHQRGTTEIRDTLEAGDVGLTICGHCHWDDPLAEHAAGQILNVDARVVVLSIHR